MPDPTLKDAMWRELERRFGDRDPEPCNDDVVAIFRPSGEHIGALTIFVDGPGFIVDIEGWFHAHFDVDAPEANVKDTAAYLDDLFADRFVLFRSPSGVGGSFRRDTSPAFDGFPLPPPHAALARELLDHVTGQTSEFFEQRVLDLLQAPGTEFTTWSSPIQRPA